MQDNTLTETNEKPRAVELLLAGLSKLKIELFPKDLRKISEGAGVSQRTVYRYVREGYLQDFDTGKKILDIGRKIVAKREQSMTKA